MSFVSFPEQAAIRSLNCINKLGLIMETQCVFFGVETEFLNFVYMSFVIQGAVHF